MFFFIPPLVFIPGKFHGNWIFVNYREPKLAAGQILSWLLISWCSLMYFEELKVLFSKISIHVKAIFGALCLITFYSCLSISWAIVPQAALYEAWQWITVCCLFYVLMTLFLTDRRFQDIAIYSLITSFAVVTIIGLIQTQITIPFLAPISKGNPISSTFGAKNTCFVTLASQLFLLLYAVFYNLRKNRYYISGFFLSLLVIEFFYLFLSLSKTTYLVTVIGLVVLSALLLLINSMKFFFKVIGGVVIIAALFLGLFIVLWLYNVTGKNLVLNPSFEVGNQTGDAPQHWKLYPKEKAEFGYWAKDTAHTGKHSVALIGDQKKRIAWKSETIYFKPPLPKIIAFSGWSKAEKVKQDSSNYGLLFKIFYEDQSYGWFRHHSLNFQAGTHDWEKKKTTKIFYKKRVAAVQPYVILYKTPGIAWFDDISVIRYPDYFVYWFRVMPVWNSKIKPLLLHPTYFFTKTARGAAILDTLDMFKDHPMGVGAGNWGFMYPLYHKRMLKKDFSEKVQIRRAHNDFIEYLGELGIVGFVLLLFLTLYPVWRLIVLIKNKLCGDYLLLAVCLVSQFVVVIISMLFTYYLEYPYRKFLFVFLLVLASTCIALCQRERQ